MKAAVVRAVSNAWSSFSPLLLIAAGVFSPHAALGQYIWTTDDLESCIQDTLPKPLTFSTSHKSLIELPSGRTAKIHRLGEVNTLGICDINAVIILTKESQDSYNQKWPNFSSEKHKKEERMDTQEILSAIEKRFSNTCHRRRIAIAVNWYREDDFRPWYREDDFSRRYYTFFSKEGSLWKQASCPNPNMALP